MRCLVLVFGILVFDDYCQILLQNMWFWFKGNLIISIIMSSNTKTDTSSTINTETRYLGRVKWFNNKTGYGFATIVGDSDRIGEDIFTHHTSVKVDSEQYKYLVQGEYVSFNLKESEGASHPFQAHDLTGICGGKLMCETRNEQRLQREAHDGERGERGDRGSRDGDRRDSSRGGSSRRPRRQQTRPRGSGPRDDGKVWALVEQDGDRSVGDNRQ